MCCWLVDSSNTKDESANPLLCVLCFVWSFLNSREQETLLVNYYELLFSCGHVLNPP